MTAGTIVLIVCAVVVAVYCVWIAVDTCRVARRANAYADQAEAAADRAEAALAVALANAANRSRDRDTKFTVTPLDTRDMARQIRLGQARVEGRS